MDTPRLDLQREPPTRCGICGSKEVGVYGPFEGIGINAECHECGAQYCTTTD